MLSTKNIVHGPRARVSSPTSQPAPRKAAPVHGNGQLDEGKPFGCNACLSVPQGLLPEGLWRLGGLAWAGTHSPVGPGLTMWGFAKTRDPQYRLDPQVVGSLYSKDQEGTPESRKPPTLSLSQSLCLRHASIPRPLEVFYVVPVSLLIEAGCVKHLHPLEKSWCRPIGVAR